MSTNCGLLLLHRNLRLLLRNLLLLRHILLLRRILHLLNSKQDIASVSAASVGSVYADALQATDGLPP